MTTLIFYLIIVYVFVVLSYPIWLWFLSPKKVLVEDKSVDNVSVIFLSYNGQKSIIPKINLIIKCLRKYNNWELVLVDDGSDQETRDVLARFKDMSNVKLVLLPTNQGVISAMNKGVRVSTFGNLVFCDQRQDFTNVDFDDLLIPLQQVKVGAVSCAISAYDKSGNFSLVRWYENKIKKQESKFGSVMGVYGPLFSLKKELYPSIPKTTILDDFYLSIHVLKSHKIHFASNVTVTDDSFKSVYTPQRATRYLQGLIQVLMSPGIFLNLSIRNKLFLLWHKYLRLLIPLLLPVCFMAGYMAIDNINVLYWGTGIALLALLIKKIREGLLNMGLLTSNYFQAYLNL